MTPLQNPAWTCPYCAETGGEPLEITSREFQGEPGHGGFAEWREERCSLCDPRKDVFRD